IDRITLALPNPDADTAVYEAEHATLTGGSAVYDDLDGEISGAGAVRLAEGEEATFWVYGDVEGEKTLGIDVVGEAAGSVSVNGNEIADLASRTSVAAHLAGGVNKVVVTGGSAGAVIDRVTVSAGTGALAPVDYAAEDAALAGDA